MIQRILWEKIQRFLKCKSIESGWLVCRGSPPPTPSTINGHLPLSEIACFCALFARLVARGYDIANRVCHQEECALYEKPDGTPIYVVDKRTYPNALVRAALLALYSERRVEAGDSVPFAASKVSSSQWKVLTLQKLSHWNKHHPAFQSFHLKAFLFWL